MKAQNLLTLMFLLACATLVRAEDEALLFRFPLAGMPVETLPPAGALLDLHAEEPTADHPYPVAVSWQGVHLGYLPARLGEVPYRLLIQGVSLDCRVHARILPALPGNFLSVELGYSEASPAWDLAHYASPTWVGPED